MNLNEEIELALESCETKVQRVIVKAAEGGTYEMVDRAREIAEKISEIRRDSGSLESEEDEQASGNVDVPAVRGRLRRRRKKPKQRPKYPRFETSEKALLRYGWSKKDKAEYNHKVPKEVVEDVLKVMKTLAAGGSGPFMAETIIAAANDGRNEPIPNYQVYAVLSFLRSREDIEQQGRDGYLIEKRFSDDIQHYWS